VDAKFVVKEEGIMLKSVEVIIEKNGQVRLLEPIKSGLRYRAILTIIDEKPDEIAETVLLSEAVLSEDWNRPEEEKAWAHLQKAR
jgi:acyl-CoA synthetase (AMP-forming)/AMP-acid ligase II